MSLKGNVAQKGISRVIQSIALKIRRQRLIYCVLKHVHVYVCGYLQRTYDRTVKGGANERKASHRNPLVGIL